MHGLRFALMCKGFPSDELHDAMRALEYGCIYCAKPVHRDASSHFCVLMYSHTRYADGQHAGRERMNTFPTSIGSPE